MWRLKQVRWFNDFLHDNEYERVLAHVRCSAAGGTTASIWDHVRCRKERYRNVLWAGTGHEEGPKQQEEEEDNRKEMRYLSSAPPAPLPSSTAEIFQNAAAAAAATSVTVATDVSPSSSGGQSTAEIRSSSGCDGRKPGGESGGERAGGNSMAGVATIRTASASDLRPSRVFLSLPLWPACGVRSLVVWHRLYSSRGLEVSELVFFLVV